MNDSTFKIPKWYILKTVLTRYKADDTLANEMVKRKKIGDSKSPVMDYYVPHLEVKRRLVNGSVQDVSSPLGGYVFLRGTLQQVTRFCCSYTGFSKIREPGDGSDFLSIKDCEMENFKLVVRAYNARHQNVPFIMTSPDFFKDGDTVRILDGDFRGVEGQFVTRQGKNSGYVVIKVSTNFYVTTLEVKSSQLQIVSFSDKNHHVYQKLDSFSPVLFRVTEHFLKNGRLDDLDEQLSKDKIKVERFYVRFGGAKINSRKMRSRIMAYVLLSRIVLRKRQETEDANMFSVADYVGLVRGSMSAVTNPVNQAFINIVLYAATGSKTCLTEAERLSAIWLNGFGGAADERFSAAREHVIQTLPLRKREVVRYLDLFRRYFQFEIKAVSAGANDVMVALPDKTYTSKICLIDLLAGLPATYLVELDSQYDLTLNGGVTPAGLAADMLRQPGKLYDIVTATEEDAELLKEFLASASNEYIIRKAGSACYKLQALGLVATYIHVDNKEWHMLMPDDVRLAFARILNSGLR